jgi:hypothetical protein
VPNFDPGEVASGAVVDIGGGRFARRQQVVYTGVYLNEIPRVDIAQSTFTADFYLWVRFARDAGAGAADPTEIDFPDLVRGSFDPNRPTRQGDLEDGTTYRLWPMHGDFKNDYDLRRYPFDRQHLTVRFFNARADSTRLAYVEDQGSPEGGTPAAFVTPQGEDRPFGAIAATLAGLPTDALKNVSPDAFRNLTQWRPVHASERRDNVVIKSGLGDPRLVGLERVLELSGFQVVIELHRRIPTTLVQDLTAARPADFDPVRVALFSRRARQGEDHGGDHRGFVRRSGVGGYQPAARRRRLCHRGRICVLCILHALPAVHHLGAHPEMMHGVKRESGVLIVESAIRYVFLAVVLGTVATAWLVTSRWWWFGLGGGLHVRLG